MPEASTVVKFCLAEAHSVKQTVCVASDFVVFCESVCEASMRQFVRNQ